MTKSTGKRFVLVAVSLAFAMGCGGEEDMKKAAPKPAKKVAKEAPPSPPPTPARDVPLAEFAKIVVDCWAAVDAKDATKFAACYGPTSVHTMVDFVPPTVATGAAAIVAATKSFWTAFPDLDHDLQLVLVNGTARDASAVVVALVKGTNTGDMNGVPPTNKKIGLLTAQVVTHSGGTVTVDAHWVDQSTMMGQLGLSPRPQAPVIEALAAEPTIVIADGGETETANLAAAQSHSAAFDTHDIKKVVAHYAHDAVFKYVAEAVDANGADAIKQALKSYYSMSSDVKTTTVWQWAAGDYVAARVTSKGTHDGDMAALKKTGKTFSMDELHILKFANGKIVEHWIFANSFAFATQLGLVDPSKLGKPEEG